LTVSLKAIEAHTTGIPILRAMLLEFPEDQTCHNLDRQFMFGDKLLVAPVFDDHLCTFYVPKGKWTSLLNDKVYEGPGWFEEEFSVFELPVLVRPGTLLAIGKDIKETTNSPEWDWSKHLEVRGYELERGKEYEVEIPKGKGIETFGKIKLVGGSAEGKAEGNLQFEVKKV
jgi:alpha-D-xyloside xylohydrolase